MIDTVTLRLDEVQFKIIDPSRFSPDATRLLDPRTNLGQQGYLDSIQNHPLTGYPKLKLRRRKLPVYGTRLFLIIEFSAPKLLYGNNLFEVGDSVFSDLACLLSSILEDMSVYTSVENIVQAVVIKVHYSKNVILPDTAIPHTVIQLIKRSDFNARYKSMHTEYANGGDSLRYRTNEFEVILYDKKKELLSDHSTKGLEKFLLGDFEVLRIECRLNSRRKIENTLNLKSTENTFRNIFEISQSKFVVNDTWQKLISSMHSLLSSEITLESELVSFLLSHPRTSVQTALASCMYDQLSAKVGLQELRNIVEKTRSRQAWYTLKSRQKYYHASNQYPKAINHISEALEQFSLINSNTF